MKGVITAMVFAVLIADAGARPKMYEAIVVAVPPVSITEQYDKTKK